MPSQQILTRAQVKKSHTIFLPLGIIKSWSILWHQTYSTCYCRHIYLLKEKISGREGRMVWNYFSSFLLISFCTITFTSFSSNHHNYNLGSQRNSSLLVPTIWLVLKQQRKFCPLVLIHNDESFAYIHSITSSITSWSTHCMPVSHLRN